MSIKLQQKKNARLAPLFLFNPSKKSDGKAVLHLWVLFVISIVCLYSAILSVPSGLIVTCWEMADLLCMRFP